MKLKLCQNLRKIPLRNIFLIITKMYIEFEMILCYNVAYESINFDKIPNATIISKRIDRYGR